jgi:hypothetical protein
MEEVFEAVQAPSKAALTTRPNGKLGQYLRSQRQDAQISIEELCWATKVKAQYLLALEAGNLDSLPGDTFTKGYLRSYASYLQLDTDHILDLYECCKNGECTEIVQKSIKGHQPITAVSWILEIIDKLKRTLTGRDEFQVY